ncbi:MAG: hypothetical protein KKG09_00735 [Verrucomicrobia bacterium]|nr:hypothetical protein [Verrucomicrobiota bacterium]MBU4247854.1 hypothetical protein [Verrucomicrobiota bacterium]MBU4290849.1 hypothetical protein [Verrucomicrobiota bacterium]MBU4496517.1 hypothetical protein [Verrucomicrobiota bacterium]MCG2681231.1 hypothetical protein [Kiritimatiellia bacterium]
MRTLYYVPIIHTSADMGSLAKAVTERGISQVGERNWGTHVATVHRFWDAIAEYCASLPAAGMLIYQDGLVAEGEVGAKIVAAGAQSGSRNYEIVQDLMRRGAQIVKTEDFKLVLEERDHILALIQAPNARAKIAAFIKYRFLKHSLLKRRDMFIAQRINETLGQGAPASHNTELSEPARARPGSRDGGGAGILFVGAGHNVRPHLPKDIKVTEVKEAKKVCRYQELLPFCHRRRRRFTELGQYLTAAVDSSTIAT